MLPRRSLRPGSGGAYIVRGWQLADQRSPAGPRELLAKLVLAAHANPGAPAISVPRQASALDAVLDAAQPPVPARR